MIKWVRKADRTIARALIVVFLCAVLFECLCLGMLKGLSHDEHQFVAPAKLHVTEGLLPYVSCPQFHMPGLVFVYATLFRFTDYVLLPARLFSVACAFAALVLIFFVTSARFRAFGHIPRFLIAAGAVLLLLASPLFLHASGRAWNHDFPVLLALVAFTCFCRAARSTKPALLLFLSGLCVGAAIAARISFTLVAVPFLGMCLVVPKGVELKRRLVAGLLPCACGMLVGALPAIVLFALAPSRFVYSNVLYHRIEPIWRRELNVGGPLTLLQRLAYARAVMGEPGNLLILLGFSVTAWLPRVLKDPDGLGKHIEVTFVWILLPFLLIGSFAPSPMFRQYLYAPMPFLVLGLVHGMAALRDREQARRWPFQMLTLMVLLSCAYWPIQWRPSPRLFKAGEWYPVAAHRLGQDIRDKVGEGKVLTLAPLFPLEGGLEIYPEFATGPFAWWRAHLIPEETRKKLGVVGREDLDELLEEHPPAAILVGYEPHWIVLEDAFIAYAEANGYTPIALPDEKTLWVAPD